MIPGITADSGIPAGPPGPDPYFANVVSLLHFDGTNGGTTFTDQIGKTWTPSGSVVTDTTDPRFGTAAGLFGTGGLSTSASSDFDFGTGDFTIEFFMNPIGLSRGYAYSNNGNDAAIIMTPQFGGNGGVEVYGPGSYLINVSITSMVAGTYYHCALVRIGNVWTFYVSGSSVGTTTDSRSWGTSSGGVTLGQISSGGIALNSYLDDFRVTKGVGRYTSNFTPPSFPFPDS